MLSFWHCTFTMPKHTYVIDTALLLCRSIQVSYYDWRAIVVRWLFMPFFRIFKSFPSKRVIWVLSIRDNSILFITNKSHKAHLLSCTQRCLFKLQKIQSLKNFVSMAIQGTQVPMYTKQTLFLYFSDFLIIYLFILYEKQNKQH